METARRLMQFGLAAAGIVFATTAATAQDIPEIVVETTRLAEKSMQPIGPMGRSVLTASIVYRVNYADLNIATHSGATELERRINDAAKKACKQLVSLYPESQERDPPCVQNAVKNAMVQAHEAIAAAEKNPKKP